MVQAGPLGYLWLSTDRGSDYVVPPRPNHRLVKQAGLGQRIARKSGIAAASELTNLTTTMRPIW